MKKEVVHLMQKQLPGYKISFLPSGEMTTDGPDLHLFYVIKGTCHYCRGNDAEEVDAVQTAVFLVNHAESAHIVIPARAILGCLSIDYYALCASAGVSRLLFHLDAPVNDSDADQVLIKSLQNLFLHAIEHSPRNYYPDIQSICQILSDLIDHYQVSVSLPGKDTFSSILENIYQNLSGDVSLQAIADSLFMSPSTVSRIFYKEAGIHLKDFIRRHRLEAVADELTENDKSILRIATDNGFSSPSTLNREFRNYFGVTPSQYRKEKRELPNRQIPGPESNQESIRRALRQDMRKSKLSQETLTIDADIHAGSPMKKWQNHVLNVGSVYALTSAIMQAQVLQLAEELSPIYIRLWNIFDLRLLMQAEGRPELNFARLDEVLDFCTDHQLRLFLDLSPRRNLARASEQSVIYDREENIIFESERLWLEALNDLLQHLRDRYGPKTVSRWVFEFSFFLNESPYYIDPHYSSSRVWELGYSAIRRIVPGARIAGPGMIGTEDTEFLNMLLDSYLLPDRYPDIFTAMAFPYNSPLSNGDHRVSARQTFQRTSDPDSITRQIDIMLQVLKNHSFSGKIYITDWGYSVANRNYLQDSCFRAAYSIHTILAEYEKVSAMGIFYASDLLNIFSDNAAILSGSGGILSRNGIHKPVYYAFEMMMHLGRSRIYQDSHVLITSDGSRDLRILCHNLQMPASQYYFSEENSLRPADVDTLFRDREELQVSISIRVDPEITNWQVHHVTLNSEAGSVLSKWKNYGFETDLSRVDIDYIRQTAIPDMRSHRVTVRNGKLLLELTLKVNELRSIRLTAR